LGDEKTGAIVPRHGTTIYSVLLHQYNNIGTVANMLRGTDFGFIRLSKAQK